MRYTVAHNQHECSRGAYMLNNSALRRRRSSVTSRVLRLYRIVLALLSSRHDNGIGAQQPILRQCLSSVDASIADAPVQRFRTRHVRDLPRRQWPSPLPIVNPATRRAGFEHRETIDIHRDVLDVCDRRVLPGA